MNKSFQSIANFDMNMNDIYDDLETDDESDSNDDLGIDERFRNALNDPNVPIRFAFINFKSVSGSRRKPASINKVPLRRIHWAALSCGPSPVLLIWVEDAKGKGYLVAARGVEDVISAVKRFAPLKDLNDEMPPQEDLNEDALTVQFDISELLHDQVLCMGVVLADALEHAVVLEDWVVPENAPLPTRLEFAEIDANDASPNGAELLAMVRRDILRNIDFGLERHKDAISVLSAEYAQAEFGKPAVFASTAVLPLPGTTHPNRILELSYHVGGLMDDHPAGLYSVVTADQREIVVLVRSREEFAELVKNFIEEVNSPEDFVDDLMQEIKADSEILAAPEKSSIPNLLKLLNSQVHTAWHTLMLPEEFRDAIPGSRKEQIFLVPGEAVYPAWKMTAQEVGRCCESLRKKIAQELA